MTILFSCFGATATCYVILDYFLGQPSQLPITLAMAILKCTPIAILFIWLWARNRHSKNQPFLLLAILLASGTGDFFLALGAEYFVLGLGAFLLAQVGYALRLSFDLRMPKRKKLFLWLGLSLAVLIMAGTVLPKTDDLLIPVSIYMLVIYLMGSMAVFRDSPKGRFSLLGAMTFIVSDSLIALNKFVVPIPAASILIMVTYYSAQWWLIQGLAPTKLSPGPLVGDSAAPLEPAVPPR